LPHPANFAPVAAVAIFGGAALPRKLALLAPLTAMILSDAIIGFHDLILVTWGCYGLFALASSYAMKKPSFLRGASLTVAASLTFFSVSNFAVWLWSGMYAHSLAGLSQCFAMALPFFRNTFLSDIIYTGALFGIYAAVAYSNKELSKKYSGKLSTSRS
jgi:hypothetical protein